MTSWYKPNSEIAHHILPLVKSQIGDEVAKRGHANDSCVLLKVHLSTVNLIYSCPALNEQFMSFIPWLHH